MRLIAVILCLFASIAQPVAADEKPVVIGVLNDMSGPYSDFGGKGSLQAVKMAAEDFGRVLGRPVQVISADHQNKPDLGAAIARQWFDEGVDAVADVGNSAVALAIQDVSREKKRIALIAGAAVSDLTGARCSPVSVHWVYDTWSFAHNAASAVVKTGGKTWFFITADYVFGKSLESEAASVVTASGGKVLGHALAPLGTTDYSSALLQAQSSGAQIIGLANAGTDMINVIKQAAEFGGVGRNGQKFAAMVVYINDVHAMGLPAAQGLEFSAAFYWDQTDATRQWSRRFFDAVGRMPSQLQAGNYSAVTHYLKAMQAAGTTDAMAVMAKMREMPVNDFMTHDGKLRIDGRLERDMYLFQVKSPADSKGPWDYYNQLAVIPAAEATRPLSEGGCPLVTAK